MGQAHINGEPFPNSKYLTSSRNHAAFISFIFLDFQCYFNSFVWFSIC